MDPKNQRIDAIVHKYEDIPVKKFGEGIDLRRVPMSTIAQTWIEMKQGHFSPLHRHEDEQTVVLISGKLRARSGPNGDEIYTEMKPGPNLEKGIQTVYMRKQEIAEAKAKSNQETKG